MASFSSFLTTKKFPSIKTIRSLLSGPATSFAIIFYGIFFALCTAVFLLLITINSHFLTTVPTSGGSLTEGVVGTPHFINPLLATTPTDQRLVALVYGSLMQNNSDGIITASLAQSYTVSPEGTAYTFILPPHSMFDDGKPLTSDDVAFTVTKLQDSTIGTQSSYWQTVTVSTPDANTIIFTLPAPDTSFLSHLTFGILPKHIWETVTDNSFATARQNLYPVGSGLMKVAAIQYQNGLPASVVLTRNKHALTKTLLDSLTIKSFANQSLLLNAINSGQVDFSYSLAPSTLGTAPLARGLTATAIPTDHTINIYRSQKDTALASATTVALLNQLIDKNAIIATVQDSYGTPAGVLSYPSAQNIASIKGFSVSVENDPTLLLAAQTFAQQMAQHGVAVSVNAFDHGTFQQNIANGTITLFLARSNDETIPSQYASTIPLYNESLPYIFNTNTHTIPPDTFLSPAIEYEHLQDWYTNTDKLWKWFIKKK